MIAAPFRPSWNPAPKQILRCAEALAKVRTEHGELVVAYATVNRRDDNTCRCCGHIVSPRGGLLWRRVHNHLHKRSTVARAEKHTTANVHLCCARCDQLITNDKIRIIGQDADAALAFMWTVQATPGEKTGIRLRDERVTT